MVSHTLSESGVIPWTHLRHSLRKKSVLLRTVLKGHFPESKIRRLKVPELQKLVAHLVQHTLEPGGNAKPQWWPHYIFYDRNLRPTRQLRPTLVHLIDSYCHFFKKPKPWPSPVRKRNKENSPPKVFPVQNSEPEPDFLQYFQLTDSRMNGKSLASLPVQPPPAKLVHNRNIPISSDIGRRIMALDRYHISSEQQLKRLERSEWYINKSPPQEVVEDFSQNIVTNVKHSNNTDSENAHIYKPPKRQYHHKRKSLHSVDFLQQFCVPVTVEVERLNLEKINKKIRVPEKQPIVLLERFINRPTLLRSSPRLRAQPY